METAPPAERAFAPVIRLDRSIPPRERMALKRDGTKVRFDLQKITRAIALAFHEVRTENAHNPYRDDALALYGLDSATFQQVVQVSESVSMMLELFYRDGRHPTIEQVQDSVERSIAAAGEFEVARAYILYRARHAERRLSRYTNGSRSLADYIAQSKYARYRADLGRRETFLEGVDRVRDMHLTYFGTRQSSRLPAQLPDDVAALAGDNAGLLTALLGDKDVNTVITGVFAAVGRKEILPSMRSMQFGGPAILTNHSRLFNCLGCETPFITDQGVRTFADFKDGDAITVLSHTGKWRRAIVRSHGEQQLYNLSVRRGCFNTAVRATGDHRWLLADGGVTTKIEVGDHLLCGPSIFEEFSYEKADLLHRLYWAYGYVHGDGTIVRDENKKNAYSMVRLCKIEEGFLPRFTELGFSSSTPLSLCGDTMVYTGKYLETLPDTKKDSPSLIRAFVRGFMDADGHKNENFTGGNSRSTGMQSTGTDTLAFIRDLFPIAGVYLNTERDISDGVTNYGKRTSPTSMFGVTCGFGRSNNSFLVTGKDISSVEEVWCLEVEVDHSFVLPCGLVTGNCSFSNIDRVDFFREYFFLLLSGCGVGFSVQKHHVALLPHLPKRGDDDEIEVEHHTIPDVIEGWGDALDAVFRSHYAGKKIEFNYSLIRPRGSPLKTSGGKAPGHRPLKKALEQVDVILTGAAGRALRTIEIYDICMFVARAVLSGGVRRSATICLFSPDDEDMMNAKTGNWFEKNPQRSASNNSAVINRKEDNRAVFEKLFHAQKEFGEPGFYFSDHPDAGCNPCVPADTWVMTDQGPRQVQDLIGQQFNALVNGKPCATTDRGFFATGTKQLVVIKSEEGFSLRLTPNHKVLVQLPANRGVKPKTAWMEAGALKSGYRVVMHEHAAASWSGFGTKSDGWLVGSLLGDGNFSASEEKANLDHCGDERAEMVALARVSLNDTFGGDHPHLGSRVSAGPLFEMARRFGMAPGSKALNPLIERTSSEFAEGFLRGWFDADGSVQGDTAKGVSIRLSSIIHGNLVIAQRLLHRLGIYSAIYPHRNKHRSTSMLPDGHGSKEGHGLQPLHDLLVSGADMQRFADRIGFAEPAKASLIEANLAPCHRALNHTNFICTVKSVEADSTEPVYDCTVPGTHAFDANGLYVHNCVEIGLSPVIDWPLSDTETANLYSYGYQGDLPGTTRLSGFEMCNLSTVNAAAAKTAEDFYRAVINAAAVGTLQASYTVMPYLGPATRVINEHDALLGVSICGFMDNPELFFDPVVLTKAAKLARATNRLLARAIGIRHASRVTCVKPEGTASLLLEAASGIHPHHSRRYFRRVQANRNEPVYQFFKKHNPQMTEVSVYNPIRDDAACFPVEAPTKAYLRADVSAEKFLEIVRLVQQTWVIHGTDESNRNPEIRHNVSNTCTVKPEEWDVVREFIWFNRRYFTGISLLVEDGDKKYPQAPREEVSSSEADIARWNSLQPNPVDYTQMHEGSDVTKLADVAACAGGSCEIL